MSQDSSLKRAVLTIASGAPLYINMAMDLAMSFLLWNKNNGIRFNLVTDRPELVPDKIRSAIDVTAVSSDRLGKGFSSKLDIDRFLSSDETLFIDSDCLVYGDLTPVFDAFHNSSLSAIGYERTSGIDVGFCKDISHILRNLELDYFPLLCGSVYFVRNDEVARNAFAYARKLLPDYDKLELVRLRERENEEPLLALAMAKYHQHLLPDQGWVKADRMFYTYLRSDVLKGTAVLWNTGNIPVPEYSTLELAKPLIVHYNADYTQSYEYTSEVARLNKYFLKNWNKTFTGMYATVAYTYPGKLKLFLKNTLRPFYRSIFGIRKIKRSARLD